MGFQKVLESLWEGFREAVGAASTRLWEGLGGGFGKASGRLGEGFGEALEGFREALGRPPQGVDFGGTSKLPYSLRGAREELWRHIGGASQRQFRGPSKVPEKPGGGWEVCCLEGGLDRHQRSLRGASEVLQKCLRTALASLGEALEVPWRCLRDIFGMP